MIAPRSLSIRLAIMFAIVSAIASFTAGSIIYLQVGLQLDSQARKDLRGRFAIAERLIRYTNGHQEWLYLQLKFNDFTPPDRSVRFMVDSPDPRFRIGTDFLDSAVLDQVDGEFGAAKLGEERYLTLSRAIAAASGRPPLTLTVASNARMADEARTSLAAAIGGMWVFQMALVGALGWWIARRGLQPVNRLSDRARKLGNGNLALRLPAEKLPVELTGLVLALNDALDRLHQSHQTLLAFNADVAHELRTPLTNLIGETELALSRPREMTALKSVLQSNLEELERLRSIINDMLFLARADAGELANNVTFSGIAAECRKTAEFMNVLFEDSGTSLTIEGDASAWIERSLFGRALTNLLHNALQHGRAGGEVTIRIVEGRNDVSVSVVNPGGPIAPEILPKIFDRFFCADPARQSVGLSHGLGLAIVQAVARMHGGDVHAANEGGFVIVGFTIASSVAPQPDESSNLTRL